MSMDYHATGAAGDRKAFMWLRLVFLSSLLWGCGSPLTEARTSFDEARYPDAVAEYVALTREVPRFGPRELFEYSLYRGLTHLALGDSVPAERWLTLAARMAESTPRLPTAEQRGRLLAARRAMGHAPGD
jgi:hypothetical protein